MSDPNDHHPLGVGNGCVQNETWVKNTLLDKFGFVQTPCLFKHPNIIGIRDGRVPNSPDDSETHIKFIIFLDISPSLSYYNTRISWGEN